MSHGMESKSENQNGTLFWAGVALAVGAFGVVIASIFYAIAPTAAALPIPNPSILVALDATVSGRFFMTIAGTVGIFADLFFVTGTLLLLIFRPLRGKAVERVGWSLVSFSVMIFITVDTLSAGVLPTLTALSGSFQTFAGFKLFFDTLFILGTIAFGIGSTATFVAEWCAETRILSKFLIIIGLFAAIVGMISAGLYFPGISLPQFIGGAVVLGSLVFGFYGIQIARFQK